MIKIYHNPRCRKSREGLQLLEKSGKEFQNATPDNASDGVARYVLAVHIRPTRTGE